MQCTTLIGDGRGIVDVDFFINEDEECLINSVDADGVNIMPHLVEDQFYDIRVACFEAAKESYQEQLADLAQDRYEERMAA